MRLTTSSVITAAALVTAVLGVALATRGTGAAPAEQATTLVYAGDFFFCDATEQPGACEVVVNTDDTVTWENTSGTETHTVTHCGDSCDSPASSPVFSGTVSPGGSYSYTFTTPGTYLYYCSFHSQAMRATVIVEAGHSAPPPPAPEVTEPPPPEPAAPPAAPAVTGAPAAGSDPITAPAAPATPSVAAPVPTGHLTVASTPAATPPPAASVQGNGSALSTPHSSAATSSSDSGGGIPGWVYIAGAAGALAALGIGSFFWRMRE